MTPTEPTTEPEPDAQGDETTTEPEAPPEPTEERGHDHEDDEGGES